MAQGLKLSIRRAMNIISMYAKLNRDTKRRGELNRTMDHINCRMSVSSEEGAEGNQRAGARQLGVVTSQKPSGVLRQLHPILAGQREW